MIKDYLESEICQVSCIWWGWLCPADRPVHEAYDPLELVRTTLLHLLWDLGPIRPSQRHVQKIADVSDLAREEIVGVRERV